MSFFPNLLRGTQLLLDIFSWKLSSNFFSPCIPWIRSQLSSYHVTLILLSVEFVSENDFKDVVLIRKLKVSEYWLHTDYKRINQYISLKPMITF